MSRSDKPLRAIPAVERVLQQLGDQDLPRPLVLAVVRRELAKLRSSPESLSLEQVTARIGEILEEWRATRLQPILNGTGVVIHTNLGRATLGSEAAAALAAAATGYTNLEYNLLDGKRGGRGSYVERILAILCGAESAAVVNNCAAALILILRHFTSGPRKRVVISRGELVQIGGGFRIPEILESSGAQLCEVGTTNRTALRDYERALDRDTALILKVHRSNFFMGGFVASPATAELADLARKRRLPFVEDLGSGSVAPLPSEIRGGDPEPTPAEVLRQGVHLVCFSGDKLLGGPQAGIVAGKSKWVGALKRDPFFRALRCDKLILAALQATVEAHLARSQRPQRKPRADQDRADTSESGRHAVKDLPILDLLSIPTETLRARAERLATALADAPIHAAPGKGRSRVGGGALPRVSIPSVTLDLVSDSLSLAQLATRLRRAAPPVVGYVSGSRFKIDLRTIFPHQDQELAAAIRQAMTGLTTSNVQSPSSDPSPPSTPAPQTR